MSVRRIICVGLLLFVTAIAYPAGQAVDIDHPVLD